MPVDVAVCAAAVADFKPKIKVKIKLKKITSSVSSINLERNPDILDFLGKNNHSRPKIVIGFSAETENLIENSKMKMKNKHCDLIVANDVSSKKFGFNSEYNKVSIIDKKGKIENISKK